MINVNKEVKKEKTSKFIIFLHIDELEARVVNTSHIKQEVLYSIIKMFNYFIH